MPQDTEESAPLSVHRAFVVHLRLNSEVARGQVAGRVEHVVSGQATHFASLKELLAFIGQVLTTGLPHRAGDHDEGDVDVPLAMSIEPRRSRGERK